MSTSVPPRGAGAPAGPRTPSAIPDEAALRRIFESTFASSVTEAQAKLGEAVALTSRVVEGAYTKAWQARAQLATLTDVNVFLKEEIDHGAARAISRRAAAARMGGASAKGHTDSADSGAAHLEVSWERVQSAIHGEGHSGDAHKEAAEASRHDAARGMSKVAKRSYAIPLTIGVIAIGVAGGVWWVNNASAKNAIFTAVDAGDAHKLNAPAGQVGDVTLSDGTKTHVAPGSNISVPSGFPGEVRAVRVKGAALFDVAPDQKLPFSAVVENTVVTATGTKFAVSESGDSAVLVQVRQGRVSVVTDKGTQVLDANQALFVPKSGAARAPTPDEAEVVGGWVDGKFTVLNKPLKDVLPELNRWYGDEVLAPDAAVQARPVTVHARLDSLMGAIAQIEQGANVKFGFSGKSKVFTDATKK